MSSWIENLPVSRCPLPQSALRIRLFCPLKEPQEQSRWWEQMASGHLCGPGAVPCALAMIPAPRECLAALRHGLAAQGGHRADTRAPAAPTLAHSAGTSCVVLVPGIVPALVCRLQTCPGPPSDTLCLPACAQAIPECAVGWRDGRAATLPPPASQGPQRPAAS